MALIIVLDTFPLSAFVNPPGKLLKRGLCVLPFSPGQVALPESAAFPRNPIPKLLRRSLLVNEAEQNHHLRQMLGYNFHK